MRRRLRWFRYAAAITTPPLPQRQPQRHEPSHAAHVLDDRAVVLEAEQVLNQAWAAHIIEIAEQITRGGDQ